MRKLLASATGSADTGPIRALRPATGCRERLPARRGGTAKIEAAIVIAVLAGFTVIDGLLAAHIVLALQAPDAGLQAVAHAPTS